MTLVFSLLIWLLCGVLAFRLDCRQFDKYEYEQDGFDGFFITVLFGGFSLFLFIVFFVLEQLENINIKYDVKKKIYRFIVGKESTKKKQREDKKYLL